jgi:chromosome segregation ATPase
MALRALHKSYKQRFASEQKERHQLQDRVRSLQSSLYAAEQHNGQLREELLDTTRQLQRQRIESLKRQSLYEDRVDRIKHDLDRLWKQHRALQADHIEARATNDELRALLDRSVQREQKFEKEKRYLKDKSTFLQGKIKKLMERPPVTTTQVPPIKEEE